MKAKLLSIAFFVCTLFAATSCEKDYIPSINTDPVGHAYLQGGWALKGNSIRWELDAEGTKINKTFGFKSMAKDYISSETEDVSIFFLDDSMVFWVRHKPDDYIPYYRPSVYQLTEDENGNIITTSRKDVFGFYAERLYIKRTDENDPNKLTFYMRRNDALKTLEEAGGLSNYMSIIRSHIENVEVDIYAERDTIDFYTRLINEYSLNR